MNRFAHTLKTRHPLIHIIMAGTVLISLTASMSLIFLPIYLMETSNINPVEIGLITGAGALAATAGGFLGGTLSDFFGRKKLILLSLGILALLFAAFLFAKSPVLLLGLNSLRGLFSAFYLTVSKALLADLVTKEERFRLFSERYMAGNIGYSAGPIIGTAAGIAGNSIGFLLSAVVYLVLFALMASAFRKKADVHKNTGHPETPRLREAWDVMRKDKVLFLFIIGSILLTSVHGEMSVTLSQHVKMNIKEGLKLFGYLMSINGITVIVLQMAITRWAEKYNHLHRLAAGCFLFALAEVGFAFSGNWTGFIVSMIVFTLGEILVIPSEYALIDEIAPQGNRGMYYGAQSFSEAGNFIGPWFGGLLLLVYGGKTMFLAMAVLSIAAVLFYALGTMHHHGKNNAKRQLEV